jgi:hypothetical protein
LFGLQVTSVGSAESRKKRDQRHFQSTKFERCSLPSHKIDIPFTMRSAAYSWIMLRWSVCLIFLTNKNPSADKSRELGFRGMSVQESEASTNTVRHDEISILFWNCIPIHCNCHVNFRRQYRPVH